MGRVPLVIMPPGKKFQAVWAALHLGAGVLSVYIAVSDIWPVKKMALKAVGISALSTVATLHLLSAVYHGQRAA